MQQTLIDRLQIVYLSPNRKQTRTQGIARRRQRAGIHGQAFLSDSCYALHMPSSDAQICAQSTPSSVCIHVATHHHQHLIAPTTFRHWSFCDNGSTATSATTARLQGGMRCMFCERLWLFYYALRSLLHLCPEICDQLLSLRWCQSLFLTLLSLRLLRPIDTAVGRFERRFDAPASSSICARHSSDS